MLRHLLQVEIACVRSILRRCCWHRSWVSWVARCYHGVCDHSLCYCITSPCFCTNQSTYISFDFSFFAALYVLLTFLLFIHIFPVWFSYLSRNINSSIIRSNDFAETFFLSKLLIPYMENFFIVSIITSFARKGHYMFLKYNKEKYTNSFIFFRNNIYGKSLCSFKEN